MRALPWIWSFARRTALKSGVEGGFGVLRSAAEGPVGVVLECPRTVSHLKNTQMGISGANSIYLRLNG